MNQEHFDVLMSGRQAWFAWREHDPDVMPNLAGCDLIGADLSVMDFRGANLSDARLAGADLRSSSMANADLSGADMREVRADKATFTNCTLRKCNLEEAFLTRCDLRDANLSGADLSWAKLIGSVLIGANLSDVFAREADLSEANLREAILNGADLGGSFLWGTSLVSADLSGADLSGCHIFGVSTWNVTTEGAIQHSMVISGPEESPLITVDNLEIAQFIHLLVNSAKLRNVIDTMAAKVVLILGRFSLERKEVLDALRGALQKRNYIAVVFDFEKPATRDTLETVSTLAHMARFVVADLTDAKSVLQELQRIVPALPSVPVLPLLHHQGALPPMFDHFRQFRSMLEVQRYGSVSELIATINEAVILPAEEACERMGLPPRAGA
jgi:uncharacterized protein YjbI with pentapeptide repeats